MRGTSVPTEDILNYQCDGNCWAISTNNDLNVFSDVLTNGQRIVGRQVARVPFDGYSPYYLRLEQRSITKTAFNFYQSLISQVQSSGSLFDVPAETRFSMNIKSVSDPAEKILGILNVFSVRKKSISSTARKTFQRVNLRFKVLFRRNLYLSSWCGELPRPCSLCGIALSNKNYA